MSKKITLKFFFITIFSISFKLLIQSFSHSLNFFKFVNTACMSYKHKYFTTIHSNVLRN